MINTRDGIFHPRFYYHARPVVESPMITKLELYKPTGAHPEWTAADSVTTSPFELVWKGLGRVQPNKDWRAREREFANEFNATQAVRIQFPIGRNLLGATYDGDGKLTAYGDDPAIKKDYMVEVISSAITGTEDLVGMRFFVRNAINSGNSWVHSLLCDTGTR